MVIGSMGYNLDMAPSQDSSDHQDYYIFNRESEPKPSFTTRILWGGHIQVITYL